MKRFYGGKEQALEAILNALQDARLIRIATAYFEASGFNLLKDVLKDRELRLLVGREQGARDKLEDVISDFVDSLSMGDFTKRTSTKKQLLDGLQRGLILVQVGDDPTDNTSAIDGRYLYQHAKLYIADNKTVVVTSANWSAHGLSKSREAGEVVTDIEGVEFFIGRFEEFFARGKSVTQSFIDKLLASLNDYDPFIIYARSILELYDLPKESVPPQLPPLASYQKPAVTRIKNTIEEHNGAMLIASTGLGKTIMAAHIVAYLRMLNLVEQVIVICPAGLKESWRRVIRASKTSSEEFSYKTLSTNEHKQHIRLIRELHHADEKTIIIIDESHNLRNDDKGERESNKRIYDTVRDRNIKVLLLTATPFSRGLDDVNSQLALLTPPNDSQKTGLGIYVEQRKWSIESIQQLSELPPCFVLTTPSVVKYFSCIDENGERYIEFAKEDRRYFPRKLHLRTIHYENPMDNLLLELLDKKLLFGIGKSKKQENLQPSLFNLDEIPIGGERNPLFESQIIHQFCSSPAKVNDFFHKVLNGYDGMRFAYQKDLETVIESYRPNLDQWQSIENDPKLQYLTQIIESSPNEKVVIFCIYIETANYLYKNLKRIFNTKVATTKGKIEEVETIIQRFAPIANEVEEVTQEESIQILIATAKISEGFNLQDASILINYDLPWTVLQLAQRMGRILRPWNTPREITVYNLVSSTMRYTNRIAQNWNKRLIAQSHNYQSFAEIPLVLRDTEKESNLEMIELANSLGYFKEVDLSLEELMEFIENSEQLKTTTFYDDLALIPESEVNSIKALPPDIRSAMLTKGKSRLFILFKYDKKYYPAIFDRTANLIIGSENPDAIMKIIRCERSTNKVPFNYYPDDDLFDDWIELSKQNWAKSRSIYEVHQIQVICSLALVNTSESWS